MKVRLPPAIFKRHKKDTLYYSRLRHEGGSLKTVPYEKVYINSTKVMMDVECGDILRLYKHHHLPILYMVTRKGKLRQLTQEETNIITNL